jgi:diaminobutyrate-2-oxoglutarate transaminase
LRTLARLEPEARSYFRNPPRAFATAAGSRLVAEDGREYVDFSAGALSYGHNDPVLKRRLTRYLETDAATASERRFTEAFEEVILRPRGLDYRLRFSVDAVASALELARQVTDRHEVIAFSNGRHASVRDATIMPYDGSLGGGIDTLEVLERYLCGVDGPAAFIVETVQSQGVNVASHKWLRGLERLAREVGALLIVNEAETGCGRCGSFFSFEGAGIEPDLVCMSTALSGLGLPLAVTLTRPRIAGAALGAHNGHDLALVTATAALDHWRSHDLAAHVRRKGAIAGDRLRAIVRRHPELGGEVRGRGLLLGLDIAVDGLAADVAGRALDAGLLIETSGPSDRVLKLAPPLTISEQDLAFGLDAIEAAVFAASHAGAWRDAA